MVQELVRVLVRVLELELVLVLELELVLVLELCHQSRWSSLATPWRQVLQM